MKIFLALFFLGAVQGLTEFLPISSSGHLVLFSKIFKLQESLFLSILLHLATLLSIIVVYHKDIWQCIKHPFSALSLRLIIAEIPTCLIVLFIMPIVKASFGGELLPACFLLSAMLLVFSEMFAKNKKLAKMDNKTAFLMGVFQGFAVFPGISRSGSTISAGIASGKEKAEVTKFSFLMSVPIILLSALVEVVELCTSKTVISIPVLPTCVSFVTAFVVGIFAIKLVTKLAQKASLKWFALELAVVSIVSLFI